MFCEDCKLKCKYDDDGSEGALLPMVLGAGPIETAEIIVVAGHPSWRDQYDGRLLSDDSGSILDRSLARAGINRDHIYVTSVVKHPIQRGKKTVPKAAITACRKYLDTELAMAKNAKVIVPMGALAIEALTGIKGVEAQRGRVVQATDDMPAILPTYDPKSFKYNQENEYIFVSDLTKAAELASGDTLPDFTEVHDVVTPADWDKLIAHAKSYHSCMSFDIETNGLRQTTADITDLAFSPQPGYAYVVQIHEWDDETNQMVRVISDELEAYIKAWFAKDDGVTLITHGGLFDFKFMLHYGWMTFDDVDRLWVYDTMYGRHVMISEKPPFKLEFLAGIDTNLGAWDAEKLEYEREYGKGAVWRMPHSKRRLYAGGDVDATIRLAEVYLERGLREWAFGYQLYCERTRPMLPVMAEVMTRGMAVDVARIDELRDMYRAAYDDACDRLYKILGDDVLLTSQKQVVDVLINKLDFVWPPVKMNPKTGKEQNKFFYTATGAPSLRAEVRADLASQNPHAFWDAYDQFKAHEKLLSTYIGFTKEEAVDSALPGNICPLTGRIYTSLKPQGTRTGRRASSDPNLQNIPKHRSGQLLRSIFVPTPGNVFLSCDLDQAEIFVAAHISKDPVMIAALSQPGFDGKCDFHRATAAFMFGVLDKDVTPAQRNIAKRVGFGTLYGSGPSGLARKTGTNYETAKEFIELFFQTYQGYADWQREQVASGRELGYNVSAYGRRRREPYPADREKWWHVDNQYKNFPIQATVGDHIATAYPRVRAALLPYGGFLVNEIHDELLSEVPEEHAEEALAAQLDAMTFPIPGIGLPIPVSGDILTRWKESDSE